MCFAAVPRHLLPLYVSRAHATAPGSLKEWHTAIYLAKQGDKVAFVYLKLFFFSFSYCTFKMCSLHPRLYFLNSLVVNHQISHNSLEPFCSDSPTETHTTHAVSGLTGMWTHSSHTNWFLSLLWLYPPNDAETRVKMQSVNCWYTRDLSQSLSASKVYELHPNSLIPPITHRPSVWSWLMTYIRVPSDIIGRPPPVRLCRACHGRGQWR